MNKINKLILSLGLVVVGGTAMLSMTSCAPAQSAVEKSEAYNRQFMSQINSVVESYGEKLDEFSLAVSQGNVVNMTTLAQSSATITEDMKKIEESNDMEKIRDAYYDAMVELNGALGKYVSLYTNISALGDSPADASTIQSDLAEVQAAYDAGLQLLKDADELALSMN